MHDPLDPYYLTAKVGELELTIRWLRDQLKKKNELIEDQTKYIQLLNKRSPIDV